MTVADIGAGSGYYVARLAPIVGPKGRIIAEDIVPKYLQSLRKRLRNLRLQNVVISLGESHGRSFSPDEFAIALEQVVAGTAPDDYRDPLQFFSRT